MNKITAFLKLIRVTDYAKNIFILLPIFFSENIAYLFTSTDIWMAFLGFSLLASAVYVLNDLKDVEADRLHPEKKKRPIAAGHISSTFALITGFTCLIAALILGYSINISIFIIFLVYVFQNILYSLYLKKIPIIDVTIVALGFIWRVAVGGLATDVPITHWLYLITFLVSMSLTFGKRYDDITLREQQGIQDLRKVSGYYTKEYLQHIMSILLTITVVCYIMYSVSEQVQARIPSEYFFITSFPVLIGLFRYLALVIIEQKSGSPVKLFYRDRPLQIIIFIWLLMIVYFNYFVR